MTEGEEIRQDWPLRTWMFFGLGAAAGLIIDFLTDRLPGAPHDSLRLALATFVGTAVALAGFTLERGRWLSTLTFSLVAALIVSSVIYWNGGPDDWDAANGWRLLSAGIAIAIAAPLFQAWRDRQQGALRWRTSVRYAAVHDRAWTNVLLWCLAWTFAGIVLLLTYLLSELFKLIGIRLLHDLLQDGWFMMALVGGALGAGVGLLRDRDRMLAALQRVAMTVLAVLAPVLGAGLAVFVLALPFTGLTPLWDATRSTTPILLFAIVAAILLANAVIGDSPEDESNLRVLRWGAMALGATMLPLAVIAAVSTGLRISQYGLTPDRLWAVVFTGIATAFGLAYALSLLRGRSGWAIPLRRANLLLAFGLCAIAFILSTPLLNFGALSARDQLARLEDGRIQADRFDWAALWFSFGPAGKQAVRTLAMDGRTADIRKRARDIQQAKNRWDAVELNRRGIAAATLDRRLVILPRAVALPKALRDRLSSSEMCGSSQACTLLYRPEESSAVLVTIPCDNCDPMVRPIYARDGKWAELQDGGAATAWPAMAAQGTYPTETERRAVAEAVRRGRLDIRPVQRRQLFIDGQPAGKPFE